MLNIKNEVLIRVYVVAFLVATIALIIFSKLYRLSQVEGEMWAAKAKKRYYDWGTVQADRGNILDCNGNLLATSLPFYDVYFDPKSEGIKEEVFQASVDSLAWCLSTMVNTEFTPGAYKEWLIQLRNVPLETPGARYVPITKNIDYRKMLAIKKMPLFREGKSEGGLIIEQMSKRDRPFKMLAQRTIGYVREGALPVGLEGRFDRELGGSIGKRLMMKVPGDFYIPVNDLTAVEPQAGNDLVTTLDINIQDAAENALLNALKKHDADHGCAVVMEVKTGAIKAMANLGRSPEGWWETFNYAVGERVEPGSMFKLASFLSLLEDGHIEDFDQKIPVFKGKVKFFKDELRDDLDHRKDSLTIEEIFAISSNVGTATLVQNAYGQGNKVQGYLKNLEGFGLNNLTGVELDGEEKPYIKNPNNKTDDWSGTTLPWMAIGYEMMVSPLQMLQFYNAVANDGRMMKPYVVERIELNGEKKKSYAPTIVDRSIASSSAIKSAQKLLEAVVDHGTASRIKANYKIAGKTGTTQLNYHKFKTSAGIRYQASFCGYFPAEKPVYSCIVVISEPRQAGFHGAEVAAPVFREIADKCYAMKHDLHAPINAAPKPKLATIGLPNTDAGTRDDIRKAMKYLKHEWIEESKADWVVLKSQNDSLFMVNRLLSEKTIPSVVGMGLKDALFILENLGVKVRVNGIGKVVTQSITPGTRANNQTITLVLN